MTTQQYVAVCHDNEGNAYVYLFIDKEEAERFVDDVLEHSDELHAQAFPLTPTTRKQALSELLGV